MFEDLTLFCFNFACLQNSRQELQAIASCYLIIARISRALHRTDLQLENFTIDNIVCSCHLGFQLNVDAFFESHKTHCEYDPEQFPGAHWRPAEAEVGFVLFESGRIACVGLKSYDQIPVAEKLLENLQDFELGKEKTAWTGQARRGRVSTTKLKKLNKTAQASAVKVDSHQFFEEFVQQVCPLLKSIYDLNGLSSLTTTTLSTSSTGC